MGGHGVKLQYLRHPILAAKKARSRLSTHAHMVTFAFHGKRRFRGDPRYDLQSVTDGFRVQIDDRTDDAQILERICEAYIRTVQKQESESGCYQASGRWQRDPRAESRTRPQGAARARYFRTRPNVQEFLPRCVLRGNSRCAGRAIRSIFLRKNQGCTSAFLSEPCLMSPRLLEVTHRRKIHNARPGRTRRG